MFLALREMKHAKLRYLLIGLIMVLISFLVLFVSGLAKGLSSDNASSIQNLKADYFVLDKNAEQRLNRSQLSEDKMKDITNLTEAKEMTPLGIQMTTFKKMGATKKVDSTIFGIDPTSVIAPEQAEGKTLQNANTNEAVGDLSLKEEGFKIGDRIKEEASGKKFTLIGFTKNQSYSHSPVVHITQAAWKELQKDMGKEKPFYNAAVLNMNEDTAKKLESKISGTEIIAKKDALKSIPGYKEEQGSLLMMIAFLFVIAAFVLSVFFYVITLQKVNQFGVLKAIGAKSGYLSRTVIYQVLSLTIISLVISIALTFSIAALLPASMPFVLSLPLVAGCSVLFLAVSLIGSLISLRQVTKIDAVEAIGRAA